MPDPPSRSDDVVMHSDPPLRRVVLLRLREATEQLELLHLQERLLEEQREKLIENAHAEGHSIEQIAKVGGFSPPTIRSILKRRGADA